MKREEKWEERVLLPPGAHRFLHSAHSSHEPCELTSKVRPSSRGFPHLQPRKSPTAMWLPDQNPAVTEKTTVAPKAG